MRLTLAGALAVTATTATVLALGAAAPSSALNPTSAVSGPAVSGSAAGARAATSGECFRPGADIATSARGGQTRDHREVSLAQQRAIEARTDRILARRQGQDGRPGAGAPVAARCRSAGRCRSTCT